MRNTESMLSKVTHPCSQSSTKFRPAASEKNGLSQLARIINRKCRTFNLDQFISPMPRERTQHGCAIEIPEQIKGYVLGRTIGKGPFSIVKHATSWTSEEEWAIKIMSISDLKAANRYENVTNRLSISKRALSDSLIRVFEHFEDGDLLYIVMDYCPNGTLSQLLNKSGKLNEDDCRTIFRGLLKGVEALHAASIAHRSLSLESVLITANGTPKICNFGCSHKLTPHQLLSSQCGQLVYAAPEVVLHQPYDARKSDMWSLGVILYCIAAGTLPWKTENQMAMMHQICDARYTVPPEFSPLLTELIAGLLERSPQQRLSPTDCLRHPWFYATVRPISNSNVPFTVRSRLQKGGCVSQIMKPILQCAKTRKRERSSYSKCVTTTKSQGCIKLVIQ